MAKLGYGIIALTFWVLVMLGILDNNEGLLVAALFVGVVSIGAAFAMNMKPPSTVTDTRRRIWAEGSPATAEVAEARQVGTTDGNPRLQLRLRVTVAGGTPKTVETTQLIAPDQVDRVAVGSILAVKVDPTMPAVVVLDPGLVPGGYPPPKGP